MLLVAAALAAVLGLWQRVVDRRAGHPCVLTVGDDEVALAATGSTSSVRRSDVVAVARRRRRPARIELVFQGRARPPLLVVGLSPADEPAVVAALRERGWAAE